MFLNKRNHVSEEMASTMGPFSPFRPKLYDPRGDPQSPHFDPSQDSDGDGYPDYLDPAPNSPFIPISPDLENNPLGDSDGDGIPNYADPDSPWYSPLPPIDVPGSPFPYGLPFPARPDIDPRPFKLPGGPLFPEYVSTGAGEADGVEGEVYDTPGGPFSPFPDPHGLPPLNPFKPRRIPGIFPYPGYPFLPPPVSTPDDAPLGTPSNPFPNVSPPFPYGPTPDYPDNPLDPLTPDYKRHPIPGIPTLFNNDPLRGRRAEVEGESRMSY